MNTSLFHTFVICKFTLISGQSSIDFHFVMHADGSEMRVVELSLRKLIYAANFVFVVETYMLLVNTHPCRFHFKYIVSRDGSSDVRAYRPVAT
jgi:hypothetical protein